MYTKIFNGSWAGLLSIESEKLFYFHKMITVYDLQDYQPDKLFTILNY